MALEHACMCCVVLCVHKLLRCVDHCTEMITVGKPGYLAILASYAADPKQIVTTVLFRRLQSDLYKLIENLDLERRNMDFKDSKAFTFLARK